MAYEASKYHAILAIKADAKFETAINDSGQEIVTWADGETPISAEDIAAKQAQLGTANAHIPARKSAYPELEEQLDLLYKDMAADKGDKTGEWFKAVKKVKDDNPKS